MQATQDTEVSIASRFVALFKLSGLSSYAALDSLAGKRRPGHAAMIAAKRRVNVRPESLEGYARVLGTSVSYLLLGQGRAPGKRAIRAAVEEAKRVEG